ncbi:hypothetical protein [Peptoclostridium acidaminophilum]|uniref:hypothetical protein n=1 Tax=Peptoclostridium acidaminophilum TaxID=1731 RepID=UPI00046CBDAA|nr:hypothetical protein [Peptoclostridium acidaminophilum]
MQSDNKQQDSSLEQAEKLYAHVRELAQFKYDGELRREDSLIQQSSNMQTAFAFSTAALFMIAPIALEYRGNLSVHFFLAAFSSITAFLLLSLAFASLAQKRYAHEAFPDVEVIEKEISDNYQSFVTKAQQDKQWVNVIGKLQKSKSQINDKRVKHIMWSMKSFSAALILSVFWYVVTICKIL